MEPSSPFIDAPSQRTKQKNIKKRTNPPQSPNPPNAELYDGVFIHELFLTLAPLRGATPALQ